MSRLQQKADRRKKEIKYLLRIPSRLDKIITEEAEYNLRSKNKEIIHTLMEEYFT